MERAIAEMEKIKRAEEIYSRRNSNENDKGINSKNIYKFLFETLFLINIVIVIIAIKNQNYIFTKEFIKQVSSYNVNLKKQIENFFINSDSEVKKTNEKNKQENTTKESESVSGESNNVTSALVENQPEAVQEFSQEEKDILEIKNNYSVIIPISGVKTSGFGERESTNSKVTKNHTGVDIAANLGTVINSATSGKVIEVSSNGDYGKHFKVQTGDMIVLYAHCSKIYVKEGQEVNQGDQIGEVGSTRKFYWTTFAF